MNGPMKTDTQDPITPYKARKRSVPQINVGSADEWTENSSDWDAPLAPALKSEPTQQSLAMQAEDLHLRYGPTQILSGISFTLHHGDTLGLLGLNGAGKSTLLKALSGAMAPERGSVHIGNNELYQNPLAARMDIGYAPDKPAIYPEFRVIEFLKFIATMRRIPKTKINSAIDNVVERCNLGEVRQRVIGNLSSGYQQRVNLAQAMIHSPRVLILDEPANGLDPVQLIEMRYLISTLSPDQATIFSSHSLSEVSAVCNRVLLVHSGHSILDSSIDLLSNSSNATFDLKLAGSNEIDVAALPGLLAACRIKSNHWMVTGSCMTAAHLNTLLVSRGQKILSMTKTDNYLDSLFRQLGATEQAKPGPSSDFTADSNGIDQ